MSRGERITKALTHYSPTRGVALILGFGMLAWGLWVALPFTSFDSPVYTVMERYAVEEVWAGLFLFGGLTMSIGTWIRDIEWIRRGAFVGFIMWSVIAILGFVSDWTATPVVTRSIIALLHAWIYVQVKIHPQLITGEVVIGDLTEWVKAKKEENN